MIDMSADGTAHAAGRQIPAELFQVLVDNLPVLCWIADETGYIYWYNRRWYEYTGRAPSEMEGWGWQAVHDPERLNDVLEQFRTAIASGEPFEMVFPLRSASGEYRPFLTRAVPYRNAEGRVTHWFGKNVDISAQVAAEEALRASEARFRGTFDQAAVGVAHVALDGAWLRVNKRLCLMLGYSEAELLGMTFQQVTHPDDLDANLDYVCAEVTGEIPRYVMEKRYIRKDGSVLWGNLTVSLLRDDAGAVMNFISIVEDISARKEAESALAESEGRLRLFIDRAPAAIAMFDRNLRYLAVSRRYVSDYDLGAVADTLIGRSHFDVFPATAAKWRGIHDRVLTGETPSEAEDPFPRDDGRVDWVRWEMTPWYRADNSIGGAVLFSEVITERKAADLALRRLNEELEARVQSEVAAREAAQLRAAHAERIAALGQLAGGIAHDFNNVLQAVSGAALMIRRDPTNTSRVERFASAIVEASERGAAVTGRLLAFARRGALRAEAIDGASLLEGLREILAHALGGSTEITVTCAPDLPLLWADKGQLEAVLINLATNAHDAMPAGGSMTLTAAGEEIDSASANPGGLRPGSYVRIEVEDTGTGMDAQILARATEPFFTIKSLEKGTGLGLSMVKGFADQSGGAMHIESAPGQGTAVSVWLPVAPRTSPAEFQPAVAPATHTDPSQIRVLLVDDDDMVRDVLAEQLRVAGFQVVEASGGEAALAAVDAEGAAIDAIVTDLSMPGMNGFRVIAAVRAKLPRLPAILVTGYAGAAAEPMLIDAAEGDFALLRKPVSGEILVETLTAMLPAA